MLAGSQISPWAASEQTVVTFSRSIPRIAAMAPTPAGTASCIYLPRLRTVRTASEKLSVPAATWAEYSPKLCPATKLGFKPFSHKTRQAAVDAVRIAGWVISVIRNFSSGPSKHNCDSLKPSASSASSKVWRATEYFSASSLPIPTAWDPWPGNRNAIADGDAVMFKFCIALALRWGQRQSKLSNFRRASLACPDEDVQAYVL